MTDPLPPIPKERDYPHTAEGAIDFARDLSEWMRAYIDKRNDHRKAAMEQMAREISTNSVDLMRGDVRPGWVQVQIVLLRAELAALFEDSKRIRSYLKWAIFTSASALVSLLMFLVGQIILRGPS